MLRFWKYEPHNVHKRHNYKNLVSANVIFPTYAFILVTRQLNFIDMLPDLINVHLIILSPHI